MTAGQPLLLLLGLDERPELINFQVLEAAWRRGFRHLRRCCTQRLEDSITTEAQRSRGIAEACTIECQRHDQGAQVKPVCALYEQAPVLHAQGIHLVSTDEKTGIQALERAAPAKPRQPSVAGLAGKLERQDYECLRHGTQCLLANFEVATGKQIAPSVGQTRTEPDFVAHIVQTVNTAPNDQWIFIADQLNTHQSASLVQ